MSRDTLSLQDRYRNSKFAQSESLSRHLGIRLNNTPLIPQSTVGNARLEPQYLSDCLNENQASPHSPPGITGLETQLSLLPAPTKPAPILSDRPVPRCLAIEAGRSYLTIFHNEHSWDFPIQFFPEEIQAVLPDLWKSGIDLSLDNAGKPIEIEAIHRFVESWLRRSSSVRISARLGKGEAR